MMMALRNFFRTYKKSLDMFKDGVHKALMVLEKEVLSPEQNRAGTA